MKSPTSLKATYSHSKPNYEPIQSFTLLYSWILHTRVPLHHSPLLSSNHCLNMTEIMFIKNKTQLHSSIIFGKCTSCTYSDLFGSTEFFQKKQKKKQRHIGETNLIFNIIRPLLSDGSWKNCVFSIKLYLSSVKQAVNRSQHLSQLGKVKISKAEGRAPYFSCYVQDIMVGLKLKILLLPQGYREPFCDEFSLNLYVAVKSRKISA